MGNVDCVNPVRGRERPSEARGEVALGAPFNPFESGSAPVYSAGAGSSPAQTPGVQPARNSTDPLTPVSPPVTLLAVAAGLAVAACVLGVLSWGQPWAVLAWVTAGPISIGVLAAYIQQDTKRRAAAVYVRPDWMTAAYALVSVAVVAAIVVTALATAFWVGHL